MEQEGQSVSNHIGGVVGPSVQAGLIQGGVHIHVAARPDLPVEAAQPVAEGWPACPTLPPVIQSLMHAQVRAAHELPYRLPGSRRPSLATVYVRQDLSTGTEEPRSEASRPTPILDGHGQLVEVPRAPVVRVAVRPPARTVRTALDGDEHLLVTGGAGQGKSTLSLRLAADIAARWCGEGQDEPLAEPVVPLRLTARELAARLELPFSQALADSAHAEYGALLRGPVTAEALGDRIAGCRWLLLVDALDEVADAADRDRLVTVLAAWAAEPSGSPYRVVVTTRPIEGAALAPLQRIGAARYELQPFDEEALRSFAENWFAEEGAEVARRFVRQIREAHLDELVRVPLLATIAAIIFQQRGDRPLPDNQYELYEAYLAFLRSARTPTAPFEDHRTLLLEHLGRIRLETDTSLVEAARDWVRRHVPVECLSPDWPEALTAFLVSVGPLVIRSDDLRFLHHSFAEHLAATSMARDLPDHFAPDHDEFARTLYAARPKERGQYARSVLLHYTRLRPAEADPLIRFLHGGDAEQHLLAARLLAKRAPAGKAAVDDFLTTVWGWAMTTQYPGGAVLAQACRATHHPGLAAWLTALMRADTAPADSRIEAASALATRLRGDHTREAVVFLTTLVDDPNASVAERCAAAEALADCGPEQRDPAERGLRAVLANPLASGFTCRTAAVALAAFGPDAREFAVASLSARLADDGTATRHLVEMATGLIEIGVEFHAAGAEALHAILCDPVLSMTGRRDAALGLASLGPDHGAAAVAALTTLISDRRRERVDRAAAALVLGELGPQHRASAGDHLITLVDEPGLAPHEKWQCAERLADLGGRFRDLAATRLRAQITDPGTITNYSLWAAKSLAGLGPEHFAEAAAAMWRVCTDALTRPADRLTALGFLMDLGDPHRTTAVGKLRDLAAEQGADPEVRCQAANRLIRSGPEFHAEVSRTLLGIATTHTDTRVVLMAWRELLYLGRESPSRALEVFLGATRMDDPGEVGLFDGAFTFASTDTGDFRVAEALLSVLGDASRSYRSRMSAAGSLIPLAGLFHSATVTAMCTLLRAATVPGFDFPYVARVFRDVGKGLRAELAQALHEVVADGRANAHRTWKALRALDILGAGSGAEFVAALRSLVADRSVDPTTRHAAAVMLARTAPDHLAEAIAAVFDPNEVWLGSSWQDHVFGLAGCGVDVVLPLRRLLADADTPRSIREVAASALHELVRDGDALAEVRRQAADEHLTIDTRGEVIWNLVELDRSTADDAIAYCRSVLEDEHESVENRCAAAALVTRLDRNHEPGTAAFLRHIAESPHATARARATAVGCLTEINLSHLDQWPSLAAAAARHPATPRWTRRRLINALPRRSRTEVERDLLADRTVPLDQRLPEADIWDDLPLAAEAEAEIRDVLAGPETRAKDRVTAASALAELSVRLVPEAARLLERMAGEPTTERKARRALAKLGSTWWERVLSEAQSRALDEARPLPERRRAIRLVLDLTLTPPESVVRLVREWEADSRISDLRRVELRFALRRFDGLNPVRTLRDDERRTAATRSLAAAKLVGYQAEDRAAAARVLHAVAADPAVRPAMRRRAAETLAGLGKPGRERAAEALRAMVVDTALSALARAQGAAQLIGIAPACRREVMAVLRGLVTTPDQLHSRYVWRAIGVVEPTEAALELLAMACDGRLSAVQRVRCAEAAVELRSDFRERAAMAVRVVARDEAVARHVRRRAACGLARWSALGREEARDLIRALAARV
ncbi:NACHT domain-containing protein [Actinosynnema sp. CS-041913]|uniref:NACHT domain-containing protein n=1 Tax=Actinosynnema sp. CS-041913 TaxID=3239917 RepID=UPI003D8E495B